MKNFIAGVIMGMSLILLGVYGVHKLQLTERLGSISLSGRRFEGAAKEIPSDIPVFPNSTLKKGTYNSNNGINMDLWYQTVGRYTLSTYDDVVKFYSEQLPANGWETKVTNSLEIPGNKRQDIEGKKGVRTCHVSLMSPTTRISYEVGYRISYREEVKQ